MKTRCMDWLKCMQCTLSLFNDKKFLTLKPVDLGELMLNCDGPIEYSACILHQFDPASVTGKPVF